MSTSDFVALALRSATGSIQFHPLNATFLVVIRLWRVVAKLPIQHPREDLHVQGMHELKRTVLHFVKTKTAVRKQTSEQEDKAGKWLFLHVSCLCVWNPTDIFHAMFGHILRRTNEIAPVLFAVAPGNQLTIDLSTDLEAVDNIHLRCLGCSSTDVRFWLCPDFLQQTDLMKTSRKKSCLLPLRDFPNQGI